MTFKPVGVDESSNFPTRVMNRLKALFAPVSADFVAGQFVPSGALRVYSGTIYRRLADGTPSSFVSGEWAVVGTDASTFTARLDTIEGQSVTVAELESGRAFSATISATATYYLSAANLVQRIGALTVVSATAITQSDTNYWTVTLQRGRAGVWSDIVSRTTRAADGSAPGAGLPWNFDLRVWSGISRYLNKSDVLRIVFTATGAPDPWTTPCASWRYEPGVVPSQQITVTDSFDRADSATSLGNADTGQTWVAYGGTVGISSGKAYAVTAGTVVAAIPCAFADGKVTITVSTAGTDPSLTVRVTDQNNLIFLDKAFNLYRRIAGSSTLIGSFGGSAMASGDQVELSMAGNTYTCKVNGAVRGGTLTDSSSSFVTVQSHGWRAAASTNTRYEDFIAQAAV